MPLFNFYNKGTYTLGYLDVQTSGRPDFWPSRRPDVWTSGLSNGRFGTKRINEVLRTIVNGVSVIPYINNSSSALLAKPLEGRLKAA